MQIGPVSNAISSVPASAGEAGKSAAPPSTGVPFAKLMSQFLQEADQPQQAVTQDINKILTGDVDNVHDVAINVAKADIAFRLVMEVRDKLISAYQEVMRMQV